MSAACAYGASHADVSLPPTVLPSLSIQVPYLGVRKKDDNGKLGPYTWMTYAQVIQ